MDKKEYLASIAYSLVRTLFDVVQIEKDSQYSHSLRALDVKVNVVVVCFFKG